LGGIGTTNTATAIVNGNHLTSAASARGALPTLFVAAFSAIVATGNIVENRNGQSAMIATWDGGGENIAVTGNILRGSTNLASSGRPNFSAPLDTWLFANAVP